MRWRHELAAMVAEAESALDPWAMAAEVVRAELVAREGTPPLLLRGLSPDALAVLGYLHGLENGKTFVVRLRAVLPGEVNFTEGVVELVRSGLVTVSFAVDEDGFEVEPVLTLHYDVELPPPR